MRESDGSLVSIDERPLFTSFGYRSATADYEVPLGDMGATGPLTPETAHTPSLAFVP